MYDEDHHKTIAQLIALIDTQAECLRLGFLAEDDNATLHLSPAGTTQTTQRRLDPIDFYKLDQIPEGAL